MMSRAATRTTAALLCAVVLVALGLAVIGLPDMETAPESLSIGIDFDTFTPGVTQTKTSPVDVPVPSRVAEARVATSSPDMSIDVDLSICQRARCTPLTEGMTLDPGPYTLSVEATMAPDVEPGASGDILGQIQIVETHSSAGIDATLLMVVAGGGLLAIAVGVLLLGRRTVVAP